MLMPHVTIWSMQSGENSPSMLWEWSLSQKLSVNLLSSCSQALFFRSSRPSCGAVFVGGQGLGPPVLKLLEEMLISEGAAMDNGIKDEVQRCYHATDEEEWQERLEVFQALLRRDTHEAGGVRNKPQRPCLCLLPARPVQEQQVNGSVQREGDSESRGWWVKCEAWASKSRGYLAGVQVQADGGQWGINRRCLVTCAEITSLSMLRIAPQRRGYDSSPAQISPSLQHWEHTRSSDFSARLGAVGTAAFVLHCLCPKAAHPTVKEVGKSMGKTHEIVCRPRVSPPLSPEAVWGRGMKEDFRDFNLLLPSCRTRHSSGWRSEAQVFEGWWQPRACGLYCLVTDGEQWMTLTGKIVWDQPQSLTPRGSGQHSSCQVLPEQGIHSLQ